jgi:hypothetical protein
MARSWNAPTKQPFKVKADVAITAPSAPECNRHALFSSVPLLYLGIGFTLLALRRRDQSWRNGLSGIFGNGLRFEGPLSRIFMGRNGTIETVRDCLITPPSSAVLRDVVYPVGINRKIGYPLIAEVSKL